ncbi:uncharacterized protein LOC114818458, partial [Antrostomus carolinensis]|uniref:uncharacterized protein LOC114818458 n=1 Tax=Antrostomus carolinensis TaxID=279965 RepID=UPI0010A9840F
MSRIMDQGVLEVPTSSTPDVAESHSVLDKSTSVEPEERKKEHLPEGLCPSRQKTSQRSSSRDSWKISKSPMAQGTARNSTSVKSQASPSAKYAQIKNRSKQSLQARTPPVKNLHSGRLEEEREDTSATKNPIMMREPRRRNSTYCLSAILRQQEAEDTKSITNAEEQTLRSTGPGSSQNTIKTSCNKVKDTNSKLSAKESLGSLGPDTKAEWKRLPEKRNNLIHTDSKYKSASADELTSNKEERQALCATALVMGQKRLSDRTEMLKSSLDSTPFADYNHLGFNLRSNIFQ